MGDTLDCTPKLRHAEFDRLYPQRQRHALGVGIERIKSGHPRHERIHLTLKKEATQPADNLLQQQARSTRISAASRSSTRVSKIEIS